MELKEVQAYIKENGKTPEVMDYIKGFTTPDSVNAFVETEVGKKLMQPRFDQYMTKGLESWKTNNLQKIVDEQVDKVVLEKYPTETEEQKRLHKLETELSTETGKRLKAEMLMSATTEATARGLPIGLIKYFVGADVEGTKAGLLEYEQVWKDTLKVEVAKVFKENGRSPDQNKQPQEGLFSKSDVDKMSRSEQRMNMDKIEKSMKHW